MPEIVSKVPITSTNDIFSFNSKIESGEAINGDAAVIAAVVEASVKERENK